MMVSTIPAAAAMYSTTTRATWNVMTIGMGVPSDTGSEQGNNTHTHER